MAIETDIVRLTLNDPRADERATGVWMGLAAEALKARRRGDAEALAWQGWKVARTVDDWRDARKMIALIRGEEGDGDGGQPVPLIPIVPSKGPSVRRHLSASPDWQKRNAQLAV